MDAMQKIQSLDLSAEINRMVMRDGLDENLAVEAADMYRKFLFLRTKYGTDLSPSKLIDAAWHQHMADTRKYHADCEKTFGEFIHHDPKVTGERMENQFSKTKELFRKEFGIDFDSHPEGLSRIPVMCGH